MPHVPDLRSHETHDLELVAAHAAGDAVGADLATAESLLAACASCAELHADLRAIAAALPAVPARPRRRDYRITPEQSAALRPTGWRRVFGAFATPKLAFTAPLGTGLAALGIAGLLLAAAPGAVPFIADRDAMRIETTGEEHDNGAGAAGSSASPAPVLGPGGGDTQGEPTGETPPEVDVRTAEAEAERVRRADETLAVLGGVALLSGVGLLGLRWASRRPV